jgi:hypothetical protein
MSQITLQMIPRETRRERDLETRKGIVYEQQRLGVGEEKYFR